MPCPRPRPAASSILLALLALAYPSLGRSQEQAPVPAVDTTDRQQVIELYRDYYLPDVNLDPGWTGDLAGGVAGTLSETYLTAILQHINYYRAMSGVASAITFDAGEDDKCQQAALMFAGQDDVSHTPGTDWKFYTADAAQAAADSNIRLDSVGDEGPGAVDRFMAEVESNNYYVGHRRWFIYPPQGPMGAGAVPATAATVGTSAIWVLNNNPRAATDPLQTSWPPAGFVPAGLVFVRWSFSYLNADFSNTNITVTKNGVALAVQQEQLEGESGNGSNLFVGDNTVVWELPGNVVDLVNDETYAVHLDNVVINGSPQSFDYTVTSVDADPPPPSTINLNATVPIAHRRDLERGKFNLYRDGDLTLPLTVSYQVAGTALAGVDYVPLTGTTTFKAGLGVAKIKVLPVAPGRHGPETVAVTLQPGDGYVLGGLTQATVTIKK